MRRIVVGCAFLVLSACATSTVAKGPSFSGQVGGVSFDREHVTGVRVVMFRADDGSWAGHWTCMLTGGVRISEMCVASVRVEEGRLVVLDKIEYPILASERGDVVAVQEAWGDLVIRKLDKTPIPSEAIPMLWIAYRNAQLQQGKFEAVSALVFNVEGIGVLEIKDRQPRSYPGVTGYLPSPT